MFRLFRSSSRFFLPALALSAFLTSSQARAEVPSVGKIALVDLQRVLAETQAGKRARKDLEDSSKAKQGKLEKTQKELEAEYNRISKLSPEKQAEAQGKFQQQYAEFQQMVGTLQADLAKQENALLQDIYGKSQEIVSKLAAELGIDLVLVRDQMTVIYTQDSLDLTAELVKRYDKKFPK